MEGTELIKKYTRFGIKGVLEAYFHKGAVKVLRKGFFYPLVLSIILITFVVVYVKSDALYSFLQTTNDLTLSLMPNLIGFNLAAYAMFIAFGGSEFLKEIVGYNPERRSLYQNNSAIFSICLLIQLFSLAFSYCVKIAFEFKIELSNSNLCDIINYCVTFFILLLTTTSIYILKDVIVNVFNLSQIYHFRLWKEMEKEKKRKNIG